ncbi:hypothetical protein F4824DRAFT_509915 [Ustulina deusta]|nr:hypothetical protein F4824DRAFT_509915 [Ustulina deusta]
MSTDALSVGSDHSYERDSLQSLVCTKCNVKYPNTHELLTHQRSERHFACNQCDLCFWTEDGLQDHKRKDHRPDLDLECFGCQSHFTRAGMFWQHLESGHCKAIYPSDIARLREKNLEFAQQLELRKVTIEDIIAHEKSHIKGDDTWASEFGGETAPTEPAATPDFPSRPAPILAGSAHPLYYRSEDFPVLPINQQVPKASIFRKDQKENVWSSRKVPTPWASNNTPISYNAVPPPISYEISSANATKHAINKFTHNKIRTIQAPTNSAAGGPHGATSSGRIVDPDNPDYNPAVFYNEILEKFVCPYKSCRALGQITGGIMDFHIRSGTFFIDNNSVQELFNIRSESVTVVDKKETNYLDTCGPEQQKHSEDIQTGW